jgi:hypothetical protein
MLKKSRRGKLKIDELYSINTIITSSKTNKYISNVDILCHSILKPKIGLKWSKASLMKW